MRRLIVFCCLLFWPVTSSAQTAPPPDDRAQFPHWLQGSFIDVHLGGISYPFSNLQLEPGMTAGKIDMPKPTVRVALTGKQFTRHLSAQITYMRPVQYVSYRDLNGTDQSRTVWMHYATFTLKGRVPVSRKLWIYGEAGPAFATRSGFNFDGKEVVRDEIDTTVLLGAGLDWQFNDRWALTGGVSYLPGDDGQRQPRTMFTSMGFRYTMRPIPEARLAEVRQAGNIFPKTLVHAEFTGGRGYSVNNFFSRKFPIFWGGNVKVDQGFALHAERNVFHSKSLFSLGYGVSVGAWKTREQDQNFWTLSVYPVLRFTVVRSRAADFYLMHSMAGPTFISRTIMDGHDTGKRFTFQDFMGAGLFLGSRRQTHIALKINHYSNGNIFPQNAGVKIPLTLVIGRTF